MPEQVERDVAEGDVLLEFGRVRDPPAELLREDERVIAQPERVLGDVDGCRGRGIRAGELFGEPEFVDGDVAVQSSRSGSRRGRRIEIHRCGTPSDAV